VEQVVAGYERAAARAGRTAIEAGAFVRRHYLYAMGDFAGLERLARTDRSAAARNALFYALIEQGRVAEAVQIHPWEEPGLADPFHPLAVSLAWGLAGDVAHASAWRSYSMRL